MPVSRRKLGATIDTDDCIRGKFVNRLRWLITLPVAIIVVVFAVNNRADVSVSLWPLDMAVAWPLFVFVFIGAGVGFLLGAAVMWVSGAPARKNARERAARVRTLERAAEQSRPSDTPGSLAVPPQPPARTG